MPKHRDRRAKLRLVEDEASCRDCGALNLCLPATLEPGQLEALRDTVRSAGPYRKGERIYRQGQVFKSLYLVQEGSAKTETPSFSGNLQVTGVFLAGELMGAESIGGSTYGADAIALETTWMCELPFQRLERLCRRLPQLQHELLVRMGDYIRCAENNPLKEPGLRTEQRVMRFLLTLYERAGRRKQGDGKKVVLPMHKEDIARYLGLTPETLSRALSKLQQAGLIRNRLRSFELLDMEEACRLVCG